MVGNLPDGLEYTYETLLSDTVSRDPDCALDMKILLQCLAVAAPELSAANLAEILAMQPGQRYLDFDDVATDPYDALDVISPFVVIDQKSKGSSIVRLCHYSLDEYLFSKRILQSKALQFHVDYQEAHAWMATICLQYITFHVFNSPVTDFRGNKMFENYTFRRYASQNWSRHYAEAEGVPGLKQRCQQYLQPLLYSLEGSPCYLKMQSMGHQLRLSNYHTYYPPICLAIYEDMREVVDDLLSLLPSIDHEFEPGYTCLTVAANWNRVSIARNLLDCGARIDHSARQKSLTPLHVAAESASAEVFEFLLDRGANPHARSSSNSTPFYRACRGGDVNIVRKLKERGSDINARTYDSWTPLMEAVENGHEDVVDLLLDWGTDVTIKTDLGWTALKLAEDGCDLVPNWLMVEKIREATLAASSTDVQEAL